MKKCTYCGKEYTDDKMVCDLDGQPVIDPTAQPPPKPKEKNMTTEYLKQKDYIRAFAFYYVCILVSSFIAGLFAGLDRGGIIGWSVGLFLCVCLSYYFFRFTIQKFILPKISTTNEPVPPKAA